MLIKDDLLTLGISPGPMFGTIFKAVKNCATKEEAISIAIAIRDSTFIRPEKTTKIINPDSVLHWCLEHRHLFPQEPGLFGDMSISGVHRMLEQGAITINGTKPKADDIMPFPIWELVFFKGAERQCTLWFDMALAPEWASWRTSRLVVDSKGRQVHAWGEWRTKG